MKVNEYQKLAMTTLNPALDKKGCFDQQCYGVVWRVRRGD